METKDFYTIATYIVTMATTIQVSNKLVQELKHRKMYDKESYEEIIWDLIEDTMELSEETKRQIKQAEKEIKEGKTVPFEEIKKKIGL
jgi:predicted transcriptional regulator|tara:strand:- start:65 stop:328 length:264 start_codon:yes stop_codon:yes gene_type:complete